MIVRKESVDNFYDTMKNWWVMHNWPVIPKNILPDDIFVLNKDNSDCYFCTLYTTNSDFGFVAWPTSNLKAKRSSKDIVFLFKEIEEYAYSVGIKLLFTTSATERIEESLIDSGYILGDKNVNQYLRWVKQ